MLKSSDLQAVQLMHGWGEPEDDISADLPVSFVLTGTAEPSDYTTDPAGLVVTILAGFDTATLTVIPVDDLDGEGPETVTVTLDDADTNPFRPGFSSSASVTIEDGEQRVVRDEVHSSDVGILVRFAPTLHARRSKFEL